MAHMRNYSQPCIDCSQTHRDAVGSVLAKDVDHDCLRMCEAHLGAALQTETKKLNITVSCTTLSTSYASTTTDSVALLTKDDRDVKKLSVIYQNTGE